MRAFLGVPSLQRETRMLSALECAVTKKPGGCGPLWLECPATLMCSTSPVAVRSHPSHVMMRVLILLALSAFINFVDRGNLSAAAPLLKTELVLSDVKLGILLAAFFWSY